MKQINRKKLKECLDALKISRRRLAAASSLRPNTICDLLNRPCRSARASTVAKLIRGLCMHGLNIGTAIATVIPRGNQPAD